MSNDWEANKMAIFTINGVNIYYETFGDKKSETCIAFFNGVAMTTMNWALIYPTFEALGWRIILHDFKGQLKSAKPPGPYTFKAHANEAKALFEHLGVSRVHIIGISYGGEVAMKFAIAHPEMVASISVINSVSETDMLLTAFVQNWKTLCDTKDGEAFFLGMMPSVYGEAFLAQNDEVHVKRAKTMAKIPNEFFEGQKVLYDTFLSDVYITDQLHQIKCPALIICGEKDILKPPKFSKIIADNIPNAEYLTLPDCGHAAIFEKPEELKSAILGFIMKQCLS